MSEVVDIFAAYECLRNDSTQKRFIEVLDLVRETIMTQAKAGKITLTDHIPASHYIAMIAALSIHRLEKQETDGLPELLRLLHIAMGSSSIDTAYASSILHSIIPLLTAGNLELSVAGCQVVIQLCKNTTLNEMMARQLVESLCVNALHDEPRLRKAAAQAIYDFPHIHMGCFEWLFARLEQHPLRALTVVKNLAVGIKEKSTWERIIPKIVEYTESQNRAVRVKALQIVCSALHYMPIATTMQLMARFTAAKPDTPGDVLYALAETLQSGITRLHNDEDKGPFIENFPGLLEQILLLLRVDDPEAETLIKNSILYGIQACIRLENGPLLAAVIEKLSAALTISYMGVWNQVYEILATIPRTLREATFEYMRDPIIGSIQKLTAGDSQHMDAIVGFLISVMSEVGLTTFFAETEFPVSNAEFFHNVTIPILSAYKATKHLDDLSWTMANLLPIEEELYAVAEENPEARMMWLNLWNVLPNTCRTNLEDISMFVGYISTRLSNHRELCRPICKIIQAIASRCAGDVELLRLLANHSVDQSTAASVVPAIVTLARWMDGAMVNDFFTNVMTMVLEKSRDPESINVACALVDVAVGLHPFLTEDNSNLLYQALLQFARQQNHFQKKGLRALRTLLEKGTFPNATADLLGVLESNPASSSSAAARYRILLMTTLLSIEHNDGELLARFLPEFVAALKESGSKTRAAGLQAIDQVASELSAAGAPLSPLLAGASMGLTVESTSFVSASIEAVDAIVAKYYDRIEPPALETVAIAIWKSTEASGVSEVARSALQFAKTLVTRVPKFTEASQLGNILLFATHCIKKTNWEIKGKGHKLIEKCMEAFGVDKVSAAFPAEEEKLLRNARKEYNRDVRKKNEKDSAPKTKDTAKFELDRRFDVESYDLLSIGETVQHAPLVAEEADENLEVDERGRIVLKDAPQKNRKNQKKEEDSDEEDRGNEVNDHVRSKRIQQQKAKAAKGVPFVAETGERFKATKGRGDQQRGQTTPYAFAPLSSKVVNKRYRGQMKAAYKKMFK